ncbi:MAG: AI-2E family transporter [bacterium]
MDKIKNLTRKDVILILGILAIIAIAYQIKNIILLFFASFVIASGLNLAVDFMSKKIPRKIAVLLLYLTGFIFLAIVFIPLFSILIKQFVLFLKQVPAYWLAIEKLINNWITIGKDFGISANFLQIISSTGNFAQNIANKSINLTINLFTGLIITFTLSMLVLYMLLDKPKLKSGYLKFFPPNIREEAEHISIIISQKVGGYVIGQLMLMASIALLVTLGLLIIKVDFALLLGLIAGILDIIPIVGPIFAVSIAALVALSQKPILVIGILFIYMIAQWIQDTFLRPLILGKFLDLHPLIIIFALLVSASTLGIAGVVLSPAIAATIYVLINELYLKKINSEIYFT